MNQNPISAAGYPPPGGGGYGPPGGGGYGGPPPGGGGYGGPPPGGGGYGGPPGGGGYGGPPPGGGGYGPPGGFGPPPPGGMGGMGGGYGMPPMGPMMTEPAKGLAIAALVCGILAIPGACCCYSSIPLGIAACVMGPIAMSKAKASPQTHGGRNMALAGLICGIVGLVFTILAVALHMSTALMDEVQHH